MALTKPIAQSITAFDATQSKKFTFIVNGGNQVVKNRLTIRTQDTNRIVYQNIVESYAFEQTLPPNTLSNDEYYNFYFNTYDINGNESDDSNSIQFYCLSEPTLYFSNFPYQNTVESNSYTFNVVYNQEQSELIDSLKFYLYDNNNNILSESELYSGTSTVPMTFSHTFNGFNNNSIYKVEAIVRTLNGMTKSTGRMEFITRYYYPQMFSLLDLENDCLKGCVKIESNIVIADGISPDNYSPAKFKSWLNLEEQRDILEWDIPFSEEGLEEINVSEWTIPLLDVHQTDNYVKWENGFSIKDTFTFTLFMKPSVLGKTIIIGDEENGYNISLVREIPYGETEVKDVLELKGYENGILKVLQRSNYVDILNNNSYIFIWLRKNGTNYDFKIEVLKREQNVFPWNSESNMEYELISDILINGMNYNQGTEFVPIANEIDSIFPLTTLKLRNGFYEHMDINTKTDFPYAVEHRTWDYYTRINCTFDDNVMGGNIAVLFSDLKSIRIKRRKSGTFDWITIKDVEINTYDDLKILLEDYFLPTNYEVDYAIVPILEGGIEGTYIINNILSKFIATVIADKDNVFNLKVVTYGGDIENTVFGTYQPLSGKYPIIQRNSDLEYTSGSIIVKILGYNHDKGLPFDRQDMNKQKDDFCSFINNTKVKILKDWNGMIKLVRFMGSPSVSYNDGFGNSYPQVTATWVEQGKFDNQADLYYNGLIDTL